MLIITSTGIQHKIRLLVLKRSWNCQDLHTSFRYRHRLCRLGRENEDRKPHCEFPRSMVGKLYSFGIRFYHSLIPYHLLLWRLQQCFQRCKRSQGTILVIIGKEITETKISKN